MAENYDVDDNDDDDTNTHVHHTKPLNSIFPVILVSYTLMRPFHSLHPYTQFSIDSHMKSKAL